MAVRTTKTILHLIDTTGPGGAETVFTNLLGELKDSSFRNVVVLRGEGWVADQVRAIGITPQIIDSKGSFNLSYLKKLRNIVVREHVNLIHAHLLGSNVYGALLSVACKKPMIATFHGAVDVAAKERFLLLKFRIIGLGASKIVCVSRRLQEQLAARSPLPRKKLHLIYNGVDASAFGHVPALDLKLELGLPPESLLVVSVGNIRAAKGYEYLVDAAISMAQSDPDIHFVVVGQRKESLFEKLKEQVAQASREPQVHWLGFRQDIAEILGQAHIFLLPSLSEGFSIATVEAMMAGVPVIATRSGGPEEIIVDRETGFLIPVQDVSAIVFAIRQLRNSKLRLQITEQALKRAHQKFSLVKMLENYTRLYQELTGG